MNEATRPAPIRTALAAPFWDACARGKLVAQRCGACGTLRHYPQELCPACQSDDVSWLELSGRGTIYSYTVSERAFHPAWAEHVPYVVATIELEEGIRMVTDMVGIDPAEARIGRGVEVYFEELPGQGMMPRFRVA